MISSYAVSVVLFGYGFAIGQSPYPRIGSGRNFWGLTLYWRDDDNNNHLHSWYW